MKELKPCPFCGGEVRTIEVARYGNRWGVRCPICGGGMFFYPTEDDVIKAWNTRAERTCHAEETHLDDYSDLTVIVCSNCRAADNYLEDYYYCPNCGAKVVER